MPGTGYERRRVGEPRVNRRPALLPGPGARSRIDEVDEILESMYPGEAG